VPGLELYDATGSSNRTQNDFPAEIFSQLALAAHAEISVTKKKVKQAAKKRTQPVAELAGRWHFKKSRLIKVHIPKDPDIDFNHSLFSVPLLAKELAQRVKLFASGVTG